VHLSYALGQPREASDRGTRGLVCSIEFGRDERPARENRAAVPSACSLIHAAFARRPHRISFVRMKAVAQAIGLLLFIVGAFVGAVAWHDRGGALSSWHYRYGMTLAALVGLALIILPTFRKDRAPDFLSKIARRYLNCKGFAFVFLPEVIDGVYHLTLHYQNQFEGTCKARLRIAPYRSVTLRRAFKDSLTIDIACGSGEFGTMRVPVALPASALGAKQVFRLTGNVEYERGRGRRLRMADGASVTSDRAMGTAGHTAVTLLGVCAGAVVFFRSSTLTLLFPAVAAASLPDDAHPRSTTHWLFGDGTASAASAPGRDEEP